MLVYLAWGRQGILMPRGPDRRLGAAILLGLGLALEAACAAMTFRYGVWSLIFEHFEYFWVYGAAVLLYLGSCALIWALRPGERLATFVVLGLAVVFRLTLLLSPTAPSEDLYRYIWDGRVLSEGINPYLFPPSAPELAWIAIPALSQVSSPNVITPYPPLAEGLFAALYLLFPGSVLAVKATIALAELATIGLLATILRGLGRPVAWVAIYAWSPLTIQEFAGHGHLDAVWLPLFLAAALLAAHDRRKLSAAALALAALLKAIPVLVIPALLGRWRLAGLVSFVLVVALGFAPFLGAGSRIMAGAATIFGRWDANSSLYQLDSAGEPEMGRHSGRRPPGSPRGSDRHGRGRACRALLAAADAARDAGRQFLDSRDRHLGLRHRVPVVRCLAAAAADRADRHRRCRPATSRLRCLGTVHRARIRPLPRPRGRLRAEWTRLVEYAPAYSGAAWAGFVALWPRRVPQSNAGGLGPFIVGPTRVGVVIPTLNEAASIGRVIAEIPREYAGNVVVVDGGSADGTPGIARAAGARVVDESRRGYGRACLTGLESLPPEVDVVVFLDGDLSDFPGQMTRLVEPIATGQADLVIGSRLRGRRESGALPLHSVLGNWLAALLMRLLYRLPITDLGPFRAARRDRLEELNMTEMTFGWPVEMLAKAARRGLRVVEVPVDYRRRLGHSKITGTFRGSLLASYFILSRVFRHLRS